MTARTAGRIAPAIGLFLLSLVLFDLMGLLVKHLSDDYRSTELAAYRNVVGLIPAAFFLVTSRASISNGWSTSKSPITRS